MEYIELKQFLEENMHFLHRGRAFYKDGRELEHYHLVFDFFDKLGYHRVVFNEREDGNMLCYDADEREGIVQGIQRKYKYSYVDCHGDHIYIE